MTCRRHIIYHFRDVLLFFTPETGPFQAPERRTRRCRGQFRTRPGLSELRRKNGALDSQDERLFYGDLVFGVNFGTDPKGRLGGCLEMCGYMHGCMLVYHPQDPIWERNLKTPGWFVRWFHYL